MPLDVAKHIEYWRSGSDEDFEVALDLLRSGRHRHALFFAELAIEKLLKALVTRTTRQVPPKTHDLLRLSDLAAVELPADRRSFMARVQQYCLEGRYPDILPTPVDPDGAERALQECKEALSWLKSQF